MAGDGLQLGRAAARRIPSSLRLLPSVWSGRRPAGHGASEEERLLVASGRGRVDGEGDAALPTQSPGSKRASREGRMDRMKQC